MSGRLELLYPGSTNALVGAEAPDRLLAKIRALHAGLRLELNIRAAVVLEQLVDDLARVGELSDGELQHRLTDARRDVHRLEGEQERRAREHDVCPDCGRHRRDGHARGCRRGAPADKPTEQLEL